MMRGVARRVIKFLVLVAVLFAIAAVSLALREWHRIENRTLALEEPDVLMVERGSSLIGIMRKLESRDLIPHAEPIRYWSRLTGRGRSIHAGEYRIRPDMTVPDLVERMEAGDVILHGFTLVEGWTFEQFRTALAKHEAVRHTLEDVSGREIMSRLGKSDAHPEGWFLPETYRFPRGTTDFELLQQAHEGMVETLDRLWPERREDLPLENPYEALILASIVERETGVPEERDRIAGVFVRRLERGMRLQTDPTVIYGLPDGEYQGRLRYRHLRTDTPYNTYTRGGLPPTPIAMPGEATIRAALNPAPGSALYFVSRNDGSHYFSDTLAEHQRAVRKYQLGEDIELENGRE